MPDRFENSRKIKILKTYQKEGIKLRELRDGEPCSHKGCLSHISHPCEGCGRIAGKHTVESAIESYKFGFSVIYDGDNHKIKYGTKCNHCGKYFESNNIDVYCQKCKINKI